MSGSSLGKMDGSGHSGTGNGFAPSVAPQLFAGTHSHGLAPVKRERSEYLYINNMQYLK